MSSNWYLILTGQFGYPQPENDFGYLERPYEPESGCPTCHIGIIQTNAFRFKKESKVNRSHFIGLNWVFDQIFVKEEVKIKLENERVSGIRFSKPVLHKTGEPLGTVFQLHVETLLPKGLIASSLSSEVCQQPTDIKEVKFLEAIGSKLLKGPFCGRTKYNFPQGRKLSFHKSIFQDQPDIVRTTEWFGSGGSASRPIIISEKVKDIIERQNWCGAFLQQIDIID